jgi:hypothetical protein
MVDGLGVGGEGGKGQDGSDSGDKAAASHVMKLLPVIIRFR